MMPVEELVGKAALAGCLVPRSHSSVTSDSITAHGFVFGDAGVGDAVQVTASSRCLLVVLAVRSR